jgi:peptide/nickel transport system substrate-binding protein
VLLQEQWRQVGVDARIEGLEFQSFIARLNSGNFDAALHGWRTTPSPRGIRSTWGSPAIAGASNQNAGRYLNPVFDSAVVRGLGATTLADRRAHLRLAYQTIVDDAAAVWLYEVRNSAAVHRRYRFPAWRSDAWWLTLGGWTVDAAERLPRDAAPAAP